MLTLINRSYTVARMKEMTSPISIIEAWLKATGMAESTLGKNAVRNAKAVSRIRAKRAHMKTTEDVLNYIQTHPAK